MFERIPASDREAWLALRGKDVTASVCGALLGVHEYKSAFDLYGEKAGRIPQNKEETKAMERGRRVEGAAVGIIRDEHPEWEVFHNDGESRVYYRDTAARIGATPDVRVIDGHGRLGNIQVKSVEQSVYRRKWMTPDREVEPPLWIAVQSLIEGHLMGADWCAVCPLVIGFGIDAPIIEIPARPAVIDLVYERTAELWRMIAAGEEPPPDFGRDGDAIEAMYATDDGSEMDLTRFPRADEIAAAHAKLKAVTKDAKRKIEALDAEMKSILGNAAIGVFPDGRRVTWKTTNRKAFSVRETTFRTLRYPTED
jgi:hypothetical protein